MTQKRLIILYWLLLIEVASFAQNLPLIDSIKTSLSNAKGKERFDLLNDLAWEYRFAYPDSTIFLATRPSSLVNLSVLTKVWRVRSTFLGLL